ncbi:diacylglycerol lipase-alpha-like isoform X2 [Clavelina lepadiformis]|uniref:diacylglycerol lipase-alpha-like isoform X2 n=1 Tax=Clavelina lepadiformis TaxID=159417 RepID=UPI0040414488
MPGFVAFKRRWSTGSDDFVLPGAILFIIHFVLFLVLTIYTSISSELHLWASQDVSNLKNINANETDIEKAKCAQWIQASCLGYIALLVIGLVLEAILVAFSMQGTVVNAEPRKPVEYIIYCRITLGVTEVIFSIVVASYLKNMWEDCTVFSRFLYMLGAMVGITLAIMLIVILVAICTYDSTGRSFYHVKRATQKESLSNADFNKLRADFDQSLQNSWVKSLRRFCCCTRDNQNTQVALEEVSHLLRKFFKDVDVVPSDLLAGLILLRHKQCCVEKEQVEANDSEVEEFMCGKPIKRDTVYVDFTNPREREHLSDLIYYCHYAVASYGSLFFLVDNPGLGLCKLMNQCMCGGSCCGEQSSQFQKTNVNKDPCNCQTSAVQQSLHRKISNTDIVYASWKNDIYIQPFYVSVDHNKKAVVVTIRGSLSEIDALTDMVAQSTPIQVTGNQDGTWKGHKGIVQAAVHMKKQLMERMILSQAFGRDLNKQTKNYRLVIVGHSLGAGVASILAILLRPVYHDLVCYAFAPPGGLLSLSAVQASKDYIYTAVFGKDLIMRTGIAQLEKMKKDILHLLCHTKTPKYRIILGNCLRSAEDRHSLLSNDQDNGELVEQISFKCLSDTAQDGVLEQEDLFPPGRIIHFVYRKEYKKRLWGRSAAPGKHVALEANNTKDFQEILVSHNMITHHWPQELLKAMEKVLQAAQLSDTVKRYSQSATLPSHTPLRSNDNEKTNLLKNSQAQPDILMGTGICEEHSRDIVDENWRYGTDQEMKARAPLAKMDSFPESSSSVGSPISPSSVKTLSLVKTVETIAEVNEYNNNTNNNKDVDEGLGHFSPETSSGGEFKPSFNMNSVEAKEKLEKRPSADSNQGSSLVNRFENYIDVVLQDSQETPNDTKILRSKSLPASQARLAQDNEMVKRAQFEPNLIPKPPRTHSLSKRPTALVIKKRDYASAPPSRTTTPCTAGDENTYESEDTFVSIE